MMTYQQPLNNIVRGTVMALAGILGGTQSLGVSGYDEAISVPSEHAHQMSIRIQQILQNEVGLTDIVDPLGGSYYVESLTSELHEQAWDFMTEIEDQGGFLASLDTGWLLSRAATNVQTDVQAIGSGQRKVVGVNFADADVGEFVIPGFEGSPDAWDRAMERLVILRRKRHSARHAEAMRNLRDACKGTENVLPFLMDAVQADVTLGEIGTVFREVFGDWRVPSVRGTAIA
jgi:methylmalonyl-CoA mutase N-terminal domain/subunit